MTKYKIPSPPQEILQNSPQSKKKRSSSIKKLYELEKIDASREKGVFTVLKGVKQEYKGYIYPGAVRAVKHAKAGLVLLAETILKQKRSLFLLNLKEVLKKYIRFADKILNYYYLKSDRFCKSGRELYKAGMEIAKGEMEEKIVLIFCMIWEYDNAYRFRGQDILGNVRGASIKELKRVLDLGIERDKSKSVKNYYKKAKQILRFLPSQRIIDFLKELDIEKIKLDDDDRFFAYGKPYNFDGLSTEQRQNWLRQQNNED